MEKNNKDIPEVEKHMAWKISGKGKTLDNQSVLG